MIPFGISISIMGMREFWLNVVQPWQERRRLSEACTAYGDRAAADREPTAAQTPRSGNSDVIRIRRSFGYSVVAPSLPELAPAGGALFRATNASNRTWFSYFRLTANVKRAMARISFRSMMSARAARCCAFSTAIAAEAQTRNAMRRCRFRGRSATASACSARSAISCCISTPGAAAACSPPSRRWKLQSDGRGWARNIVNRLCIDLLGRVSEPCTRDNVKESYLTPIDHPIVGPAVRPDSRSAPPAPGRSTTATDRRPPPSTAPNRSI